MVFYTEERRIDFDTKVIWHERHRVLKTAFYTAIDAAQVRCEVQYGHIFRNTHRNLPQDRAKFEICAHKWICVEEPEGGVALLNDSKYGHDVLGGRMRLSLLRSPIAPDPEADQGEHHFVYTILPFAGSFNTAGVIRAGYELNDGAAISASAESSSSTKASSSTEAASPVEGTVSMKTADSGNTADYSLCSVDGESVIIESVKAPECRRGHAPKGLVIRLYESLGGNTRTVLRFNQKLASAQITDMLEGNAESIPVSGQNLALEVKPFEIKTLLVSLR
jgi:alpha-mannosidase